MMLGVVGSLSPLLCCDCVTLVFGLIGCRSNHQLRARRLDNMWVRSWLTKRSDIKEPNRFETFARPLVNCIDQYQSSVPAVEFLLSSGIPV
jgi:hypothetical protein